MKISYNWLSQYVDIPFGIEELAEKLTMAGLEIEDINRTSEIPDGIVVAEILERKAHPDADKLSVCTVSAGGETLQIVCGAPNCDRGVKAPLAMIGTVFKDTESGKEFKIKKTKLRGVESSGMLCSSRELGLDADHDGIMELSEDLEPGTPFSSCIDDDTVFTVEVTPNRPDWLSHCGVARDVAALCGTLLKFPPVSLPDTGASSENTEKLVEVRDFDLCPRYTARLIKNVKVKESPEWLKKRLLAIGLRPINNIVDITNFVLHELGQPLHAFDLDLLREKRIVVRRAGEGEKIKTLDGTELQLKENHLVIADAEKPVALAGVMGGEYSGVTGKTVNVLLESASFNRSNVRATSRELGISTDSSYRFERGVDYNMAETASNRAAALILELAGGEIASGLVDANAGAPDPVRIDCRFERVRRLIGVDISNENINGILKSLGLELENISEEKCSVVVPSFRLDLHREADLAEEVARIHGLDKIPLVPLKAVACTSFAEDSYFKIQQSRSGLLSLGLTECVNYTLTDEASALADSRFCRDDLIVLDNPISIEQAYMRPSLLSGMLANLEYNAARRNSDLALFEIGRVFCANETIFPEERYECCIALTGAKHPERFSTELDESYDFYDLKGILESWLDAHPGRMYDFEKTSLEIFREGACAKMLLDGKEFALFGELSEAVSSRLKLKKPLFLALADLRVLWESDCSVSHYMPLSQYPAINRDVAFIADKALEHGEVVRFINSSGVKNLEKIELFDIFTDDSIGHGRKSMAYSLTFRHPDRTLTDSEVNKAHEKLREAIAKGLQVELR